MHSLASNLARQFQLPSHTSPCHLLQKLQSNYQPLVTRPGLHSSCCIPVMALQVTVEVRGAVAMNTQCHALAMLMTCMHVCLIPDVSCAQLPAAEHTHSLCMRWALRGQLVQAQDHQGQSCNIHDAHACHQLNHPCQPLHALSSCTCPAAPLRLDTLLACRR